MVSQSIKTIGIWDKNWSHTGSIYGTMCTGTMCKKYETDVLKIKKYDISLDFYRKLIVSFVIIFVLSLNVPWHYAYITGFWMIT